MKKTIAIVLAFCLALAGCGKPLHTEKKEYPTYGFINESTQKSKDVCYEISVGNVVWAIILVEVVLIPTIYFVGWSLWNPVRLKKDVNDQCTIDS